MKSLKAKEDFHPYFALRRVWRAMSLLAPSLQLPAKVEGYETRAYPFAVKPDQTMVDLLAGSCPLRWLRFIHQP